MAADKIQFYADEEALNRFRGYADHLGMSKTEAGTRLFDWFMSQPELWRRHILQPFPPDVAPQIALIELERMAGRSETEADRDESLAKGAAMYRELEGTPPAGEAGDQKNAG